MKYAEKDGYATVKVEPAAGQGEAVEVRRKIAAGDRVPEWLATEGTEIDVPVKETEPALGAGYTTDNETTPLRDVKAERHMPPGAEEDELANSSDVPAAARKAKIITPDGYEAHDNAGEPNVAKPGDAPRLQSREGPAPVAVSAPVEPPDGSIGRSKAAIPDTDPIADKPNENPAADPQPTKAKSKAKS